VKGIPADSSVTPATDRVDSMDSPGRRRFHLGCILATPLVQWWINHNLFITPALGWLDPWVYTGYFLSLPTHIRMFGETYYATRLGWLLPGFVVHTAFSPLVANYVLHLSFLYVLLFAIYYVIAHSINRHAAIVATLMFAWNPTILGSLSWDYPDGSGIVFIALSLLCLERLSCEPKRWWLWALSAGAAMVAMISSNFFLVVLCPVLASFLIMRVGLTRWQSVAADLLVVGAGAAAMLGAFAFVDVQLGGPWLFLGASMRQSRSMLTTPNIWGADSNAWVFQATWLVLPVGATIGALTTLMPSRRTARSFATAIQLSLLISAAIWLLWPARIVPVLFIFYYASYLFPLALFALFVQGPLGHEADVRTATLTELGLLGLFVLAHWLVLTDVGAFWWRVWQLVHVTASPQRLATAITLAACLLAVFVWRFVSIRWLQKAIFATLLTVSYLAVPGNWPVANGQDSRRQFERTVAAHRFIRDEIGVAKPRFWYHATPATTLPFIAIASTYLWGYVVINEALPLLKDTEAANLMPGTPLVLLAGSAEEAEGARRALAAFGFDYIVRVQKTFADDEMSFVVVVANLVFNDFDTGRPRAWQFREWQGEAGAVVGRDSPSGDETESSIALPPNAFAWTATRGAPAGRYMASLLLKGEGTVAVRINGLDKPWPVYNECVVNLIPSGESIQCAFRKPADRMGVELALINRSQSRVVVSAAAVTARAQ